MAAIDAVAAEVCYCRNVLRFAARAMSGEKSFSEEQWV
jgi:hypothetical protein